MVFYELDHDQLDHGPLCVPTSQDQQIVMQQLHLKGAHTSIDGWFV